ncbi:sensor histidine kinase [Enterococcus sp. JM9B]|uniref:sensor histidine kinase n=1 Tax=Enterococcus sp. JM9B TaxID=1857216 RepID=UPI001374D023|nr:histidine kinase [Enterococcus sp. JM9B]KAF1302808.1 hypothetical protein BAU16_05940 [Enterococcus sp. JM9B]
MSINKQLQWSTFLITTLSLFILLFLSFTIYYQSLQSNLKADTKIALDRSANIIENRIDEIDILTEKAQFFSKSSYDLMSDLRKYQSNRFYSLEEFFHSEQEIKAIFRTLIYRMDYINFFALVLPNGQIISYSNTQKDFLFGYNPLSDPWYEQAVKNKGDLSISVVKKNNIIVNNDGEPTLLFSRGIYDFYSKKLLGTFVINCEPQFFNFISDDFPDKVMGFSIKDIESKQVLYSYSDKKTAFTHKMVKKINDGQQPLNLTAKIDITEYFQILLKILLYTLFVLLMVLLFAFLGSKLFSQKFTKPIVALSKDMNEKNRLDQLKINIEYINRKDEIGTLYREFDHLLASQQIYMKQKIDYEKSLMQSELNVYKNQIDSHFLYNTLESINSIAEIEDLEDISSMTISLSKMFRYASNGFVNIATLRNEIENVEDYLTIQRVRFQNSFDFIIFTTQPDLLEQQVPKLILQPVVENAIFHGLNRGGISGKIRLFLSLTKNNLLIRIYDNGVGMTKEQLRELNDDLLNAMSIVRERTSHIGLINIEARIKNIYGNHYGISVYSHFGRGTLVEIRLPTTKMEEQ